MDLTAALINNGVVIDELAVVQIGDIVLMRGKTNDKTKAEEASRIATTLENHRVANLPRSLDSSHGVGRERSFSQSVLCTLCAARAALGIVPRTIFR